MNYDAYNVYTDASFSSRLPKIFQNFVADLTLGPAHEKLVQRLN